MTPDASDASLEGLTVVTKSTNALITQFETLLHSIALDKPVAHSSAAPDTPAVAGSVDALALAHDSASLVKAHTTKLSLLVINEPFTPSAIARVLRELVAGPIPGLASAVQVCEVHSHTSVTRHELAWRCYRVLKELRGFIELIPLDGKTLSANKKNGAKGDKGSMVSTGVIWAACDDVILLKKLGIAGLLVKKAEEYRDTLQDVLDELKEWSEEVEEEEDDDDDDDDDSEGDGQVQGVTDQMNATHLSAQEMIDDLMTAQHIPRGDPDRIRERLDSCLKRLRLTALLYSAIIKRRLKALPPLSDTTSSVMQRLDELFPILKRLPLRFGDAACAFYELDPVAIDNALDTCFFDAFAAAEMLKSPWDKSKGTSDEFTTWADKFQTSIKKPA
ncbi:hypothetical protein F5Y18DRAFT_249042 [Xylariaceae sp. FL1019]|nr:hypothetical protein F5Y18DRAFT_249042 [Xylariaceae sp. FL1019]